MSTRWQILIGVGFSIVAVIIIFQGVDVKELMRQISGINYLVFIPFIILETLSLWARGMRWRVLLEEKLDGTRLFWITNISYYLSNILPLRIGELARVYLATRNSDVNGMQALSTALLERMLDVITVFLMLFAVLHLIPNHGLITTLFNSLVVGVVLMILILFFIAYKRDRFVQYMEKIFKNANPIIKEYVFGLFLRFFEAIYIVRGRRLLLACVWCGIIWFLSAFSTYNLLIGFVPDQNFSGAVFVTALLALGIALPSVPASIGLWEASAVAALSVLGVGRETALAFAIVIHFIVFVKMAIFGIIGLKFEGESLNELSLQAGRFVRTVRQGTEDKRLD